MSILIKGLEMPVCCTNCPFEADTTYVCRLTNMINEKEHLRIVKPEWCPLVEEKTGEWIKEPNCMFRCSVCGEHYPSTIGYMRYRFCPNCGAKMEVEHEQ